MRLTPLQVWIARKIGCSPKSMSREKIEAYQLRKLNETLQLAKEKSNFYRKKLAGLPSGLTSLSDLVQYPFTTDEEIRKEALQFLCVSQNTIQRVVTLDSSGTTGIPKRLYFTHADQELTIDFFGAGMSTLVSPGDRVLILLPGNRPGSVGDLLALGLQRIDVTGIKHGPVVDPFQTIDLIIKEKINCLVGVPSQVLALARYGQAKPIILKSVLLSTDYVPGAIIKVLKKTWGCEVFDHYGMTEMGLGGGVSCAAQYGYHLREADLFFEIVDPLTGNPISEGESGEVVFTTLTRQGMPLIRYRTGDISYFMPGACTCGTILKSMAWVKYRARGIVKLGNQFIVISDLDEVLFPIQDLINYSVSISEVGEQDCLSIEALVIKNPDNIVKDIQQALDSVPAIRSALDAGLLITRLTALIEEPHERGKMIKRQFNDMRDKRKQDTEG